MRINNKKNRIRTHRYMWKTLDGKNHEKMRRRFIMSKIGTKWES